MACTSYHKPTARWLTSFGRETLPGSIHTISVGHPVRGGEFTTYRLGEVVATDERGEPLFDLDEAEIALELWGRDGSFYTREALATLHVAVYWLQSRAGFIQSEGAVPGYEKFGKRWDYPSWTSRLAA